MFAVLQRWEKGCLETINDCVLSHIKVIRSRQRDSDLQQQLAEKDRKEKALVEGARSKHIRVILSRPHVLILVILELKNNSQVAEDYRFQLEAKQNFVNNGLFLLRLSNRYSPVLTRTAIQTIDELARRVRERDDELKQKGEEAVALRNKLVDAQQRVVNAQERAVEAEQAVRRERDQMHKLEATVKEGLSHWRTHYERQDQEDGRAAKRAKYIHWPND
ncbi:hypothetical protein C8J57DRAFT_1367062 [Mycena rebaudengoi]|nr:hypothetical protein C8J57DRAFT_1367062 [Mycena rebaudengoi]